MWCKLIKSSGYNNYNNNIITSNLITWLDASDTSSYNPLISITNWNDLSSNNTDHTINGTVSSTGGFSTSGFNWKAISFNGINTYTISTPLLSYFNSSSFNQTQEIWFKNSYNNIVTSNGVIIDELGTTTINTNWHDSQLEIVNNNVYIRVWNNLNFINLGNVSSGNWNHAVWRYNNSTSTLDGFLNGIKSVSSINTRIIPSPNYYTALGVTDSTNMGSGIYFKGLISIYRNYNKVLSDSEVLSNYNNEKYKFI